MEEKGRFKHEEVIECTATILKERQVNHSLDKDVKNQIGGLYRMNAGGATGYLFNVNKTGKEIAIGMFNSRLENIDVNQWDYIADMVTGKIFKLYRAPQYIMNDLKRWVM